MVRAPRLYFDSVHIIESLRPDDHHTGRRLYEDLAPLADASTPPVTVRFHAVQSRAAFLKVLRSIAEDARLHSHSPILHIETHGDFTGIQVTSGEYLPWREFKNELIAINAMSRLNLLVMLAACQGIYLSKIIQAGDRAPVRALIGPIRRVDADEIERACPAFYRTLFDTWNVEDACCAMNNAIAPVPLTFVGVAAERLFYLTMHGYFTTYCSEEALARRENTRRALLERLGISEEQREHDRQWFHSHVRDHRRHFETFKNRFFFCDLYPENAARFGATLEDCQRDPSAT